MAGHAVDVDDEIVIGRQAADLTIADDELSRHHAKLRPVERGVIIEDLGSLNGTFVDGERITAPRTLTSGATIRVGRSELALELAFAEPTRLRVSPVPPAPERAAAPGIPHPDVTRVRPIPSPGEPVGAAGAAESSPGDAPPAIPRPEVTRVRPVPTDVARTQVRSTTPPANEQPPLAQEAADSGPTPRRVGRLRRWLRRLLRRGGD